MGSMLIPQFSIRRLLVFVALCGPVSLVLSFAVRGQAWAIGMVIGLAWLVLTFAVFAAVFSVAWLLANMLGYQQQTRPLSESIPAQGVVPPLLISEDPE